MDAELDRQSAAWDTIRVYLLGEKDRIVEEIRAYPTPIPRCDAQFNHLIEKRERLFEELVRLDTAATSSTVAGDGTARIDEFIDSSDYLDDDAKLRFRSTLSQGLVKPELCSERGEHSRMPPRFSLIVPAYNEERLLGRLLDSVDAARATCGSGDAIEVIVADNASTDRTAAIAASRACRVIAVEKRVIAAARNAGARAANGEFLAFVDADAQIHPDTFVEIDRALADPRVVAGATGVRPERWSIGIAITFGMILPIIFVTGMDTGVVFCRKKDFGAVGGYDESRLVAEDVAFLWALRGLGKTRGQRLARTTRAKAVASTRKFDEFGDWHFFSVAVEGLRHLMRRDRTRFTDRYWYKPNR